MKTSNKTSDNARQVRNVILAMLSIATTCISSSVKGKIDISNAGSIGYSAVSVKLGNQLVNLDQSGFYEFTSTGIAPKSKPKLKAEIHYCKQGVCGENIIGDARLMGYSINGAQVIRAEKIGNEALPNQSIFRTLKFKLFDQKRDNISPRELGSQSSSDTLKVFVNGIYIANEILTHGDSVAPDIHIVQRNISVVLPARYSNQTVHAVWWTSDSIARVIRLGQGTSTQKYSGYLFTAYSGSEYFSESRVCNLFVRTLTNGTLQSYSSVSAVLGATGNLDYDSTQLRSAKLGYLGMMKTPNDSSMVVYNEKYSYSAVYDTVARYVDSAITNYWHGKLWIDANNKTVEINGDTIIATAVPLIYSDASIVKFSVWESSAKDSLAYDTLSSVIFKFVSDSGYISAQPDTLKNDYPFGLLFDRNGPWLHPIPTQYDSICPSPGTCKYLYTMSMPIAAFNYLWIGKNDVRYGVSLPVVAYVRYKRKLIVAK